MSYVRRVPGAPAPVPAAPAAPTPAAGTPAAAPTAAAPAVAPTVTPTHGATHVIRENFWFFMFPVLIAIGIIVGHIALHHRGWRNWWVGGLCGFAVAAILYFIHVVRSMLRNDEDGTTAVPAAAPAAATAPAPPAAPAAPGTPATPTNPGLAGNWTDPAGVVWHWDLTRWWRWDVATSTWV